MSVSGKEKIFSEEHRRKIGKANIGRIYSIETRKKMSESKKGRIASAETRQKMSKSQKGRTHSEETRKKLSASSKGRRPANCSSKYIGVGWRKRDKRWVANIRINGKTKYIGSFTDELEAAIAYQQFKNITS